MRRETASLVLGLLLSVSLVAKGLGFARSDEVVPQDATTDIVAFLEQRGFAASVLDRNADPVWVVGRRGDCLLRIADISPQGWHRAAAVELAAGKRLHFAFAGQLHADQPVARTKLEDYRRRLLRYLRVMAPAPLVRAIVVAPSCPEETLGPGDAELLSN